MFLCHITILVKQWKYISKLTHSYFFKLKTLEYEVTPFPIIRHIYFQCRQIIKYRTSIIDIAKVFHVFINLFLNGLEEWPPTYNSVEIIGEEDVYYGKYPRPQMRATRGLSAKGTYERKRFNTTSHEQKTVSPKTGFHVVSV